MRLLRFSKTGSFNSLQQMSNLVSIQIHMLQIKNQMTKVDKRKTEEERKKEKKKKTGKKKKNKKPS